MAKRFTRHALRGFVATAVAAASLTVAAPAASADPVWSHCGDGYQVGSTAYLTTNGTTIASVKQYWSNKCNSNWAYVYVWSGARNAGYKIEGEIFTDRADGGDRGTRPVRYGVVEALSAPVKTGGVCSRAALIADVFRNGSRVDVDSASTSWRCG